MSVFLLCEQAIGLVRGKRLILSANEKTMLENLNYEGLTVAHAQDEAVVCALHFARVRDRLLQLYAWTFARKKTTLANGASLPADFLNMLYVLVNGEPVDYEINGNYLNVQGACEIHYTARITDTSKWSSIFSDLFCYSLAVEICTAITGKPEYVQILEQKAQEIIHRAFQIGAIKAEVKLSLSQEIYNRAIALARGQRTISPTSTTATEQGIDNAGIPNDRTQAEIQTCKRASDSVRDRLLGSYAWVFARKNANLTQSTSGIEGWSYGYSVPADCLKVLTVIKDGEPVDFEETGGVIYCNIVNPAVRYTAKITDFAKWQGIFTDVFVADLAQEIVLATTHAHETVQLLEQKKQLLINEAVKIGAIKAEAKIPLNQEIFNRAIALSRGQRTLSPTSTAITEQGVDITGDINFREREAVSVCRRSADYVRDKLLQAYAWTFARKSASLSGVSAVSGWDNGYKLPDDCMNILSVFSGDEPVDYEVINNCVYCNGLNASIRYTARITDYSKWVPIFADVFVLELAQEIISATTADKEQIALLEQKKQALILDAYKTGAIKNETRITLKQEIFNRAIGLVKGQKAGEQPDFIDNRYEDEISACKRGFNSIRDRLLQNYAWVFARKTYTPALLSEGIPGWRYTYALPSDCLKVIAVIAPDKRANFGSYGCDCMNVSDYSDNVELTDFETTDKMLCTNREVVYIRYTSRIEDISKFTGTFTDALVIMLAIEVAYNVTDDKPRIQLLEQKLAMLIQEAKDNGEIKQESGLPKQHGSLRSTAREMPYLDYSGIPTIPCLPTNWGCVGGYYF